MGIAHVPEGRRVFSQLSVMDNLKMGAFTRSDAKEKEETLEKKEENLLKRNEETTRQQNALKAKEGELDKKLDDEIERAQAAEEALRNDLNAEIERATAVFVSINSI